jgi:3',5'-cyclic AMP phosphodiesterase CpdA
MTENTIEIPQPGHLVLHLSDTHLVDRGELLHDLVDAEVKLRNLFEGFARSDKKPDAIVVTGDIADNGQPEAYRRIREIVESAAAVNGTQIIWVMGNHDERRAFHANLLDEPESLDSVDRVFDVNGLRIVVLDSTVPGHHHGVIDEEQLRWLGEVLATPAPHGTLLALHHPPVPSPLFAVQLADLHDQDALAEVLRGTDVRGILAGHLHYSTFSTFADIPVSVASATCYTEDLNIPAGRMRGQDGGQSFNLVQVFDDRVVHLVVPSSEYPTVTDFTVEDMLAYRAASEAAAEAAAVETV